MGKVTAFLLIPYKFYFCTVQWEKNSVAAFG